MWDLLVSECNFGVQPDFEHSYYVGDAAGRPARWDGNSKTKKDFSCSDRKFAKNIRCPTTDVELPFHTERVFFDGEDECDTWAWGVFDPYVFFEQFRAAAKSAAESSSSVSSSTSSKASAASASTPAIIEFEGSLPIARASGAMDVVLMVAPPGSGKSTFVERHLSEYTHINRDTLKTDAKCKKAMEAALAAGKNVVVDNTNPKVEKREVWIKIAQKHGAKSIRCFHLSTERKLAEHMNLYREKLTRGESKRVPGVGYAVFYKHFVEPVKEEGFTEICRVNFVPHFEDDRSRKLFMEYN
jgi:bifunctional polynucleotide phosphatase/kinase